MSRMLQPVFFSPKIFPPLPYNEMHVWYGDLVSESKLFSRFEAILSSEELDKATRFIYFRDQVKYVLAHGYLRVLLGKYINQHPIDLKMQYDDHGKPFLESRPVEFNMSHSGNLGIFAFSKKENIGIDLEVERVIPDAEDIILRLFSRREARIYNKIQPDKKSAEFLKLWTRGEALVKAIGFGFGQKVGTVGKNIIRMEGTAWRMVSFSPVPQYVCSLVTTKSIQKIFCMEIDDSIISFPPAI